MSPGRSRSVFAIPELYGVFAGHNGRIPTLSNTVGNLLDAHDYLSVFVVAILVFAVIHVVRIQLPVHRREEARRASAPDEEHIDGRWMIAADAAGDP